MFKKADHEKPRIDLVCPEFVEGVARVMTHGARKYGSNNWQQGCAWGRYYAAGQRHFLAWWRGEDKDPETGENHLLHLSCCALILYMMQKLDIGTDDRRPAPQDPPEPQPGALY